MSYDIRIIPVHQWTHREFIGVDPWANNRPVKWSVVVYRMLAASFVASTPIAQQSVPADSNDIPKKFAIGIFSKEHNRYRVLPLALQDMWRAGQVRDQDLPWLLHQVEQPLRISDYPPGRLPMVAKMYTILCAVLTLLAFFGYASSRAHSDVGSVAFGTAVVLAPLTVLSFLTHLFWQQRRKQLAETWLRILQGIDVSRPRSRSAAIALVVSAHLLVGGIAMAQPNGATINFLSKTYHLGSYNQKTKPMWEFVAAGEDINAWTTLMTIIDRPDAHTRGELDRVAEGIKQVYESHGAKILMAKTMVDRTGAPYDYLLVAFDEPAQHRYEMNFVKVAQGKKNVYTVIYGARISDPTDYLTKAKRYLSAQSGPVGDALEKAVLPDIDKLPRTVF